MGTGLRIVGDSVIFGGYTETEIERLRNSDIRIHIKDVIFGGFQRGQSLPVKKILPKNPKVDHTTK